MALPLEQHSYEIYRDILKEGDRMPDTQRCGQPLFYPQEWHPADQLVPSGRGYGRSQRGVTYRFG